MDLVYVQCGPIRSPRRCSEHHYAVAIVGKDAGDVELLSTGSQLESADQCLADLIDAGVVAAQWTRAIEVEYSVWRQVLQCRGQISCREGVVRTANSLDVGVLWHAGLLHRRAPGTFPHLAVQSKWAPPPTQETRWLSGMFRSLAGISG